MLKKRLAALEILSENGKSELGPLTYPNWIWMR